jgi:hypothetical protein
MVSGESEPADEGPAEEGLAEEGLAEEGLAGEGPAEEGLAGEGPAEPGRRGRIGVVGWQPLSPDDLSAMDERALADLWRGRFNATARRLMLAPGGDEQSAARLWCGTVLAHYLLFRVAVTLGIGGLGLAMAVLLTGIGWGARAVAGVLLLAVLAGAGWWTLRYVPGGAWRFLRALQDRLPDRGRWLAWADGVILAAVLGVAFLPRRGAQLSAVPVVYSGCWLLHSALRALAGRRAVRRRYGLAVVRLAGVLGIARGLVADAAPVRARSADGVTDVSNKLEATDVAVLAYLLIAVRIGELDTVAQEAQLHALAELAECHPIPPDVLTSIDRVPPDTVTGSQTEYVEYLGSLE